jgi:hypothetical protein
VAAGATACRRPRPRARRPATPQRHLLARLRRLTRSWPWAGAQKHGRCSQPRRAAPGVADTAAGAVTQARPCRACFRDRLSRRIPDLRLASPGRSAPDGILDLGAALERSGLMRDLLGDTHGVLPSV